MNLNHWLQSLSDYLMNVGLHQRVYKIDQCQTTKIHDDKPCKPIEGSLVYTTFISVSPSSHHPKLLWIRFLQNSRIEIPIDGSIKPGNTCSFISASNSVVGFDWPCQICFRLSDPLVWPPCLPLAWPLPDLWLQWRKSSSTTSWLNPSWPCAWLQRIVIIVLLLGALSTCMTVTFRRLGSSFYGRVFWN